MNAHWQFPPCCRYCLTNFVGTIAGKKERDVPKTMAVSLILCLAMASAPAFGQAKTNLPDPVPR
jgi:hypothetical protein